ncbi:MAG: effector binding domain-containing protein, partial [Ruminococcus sp.]|nr:effector binding domain-containing protein [Ruminococcus sp.]
NEKALGIYTDYENDEKADYTLMTACEVTDANVPGQYEVRTIPAGKYAKFVVKGNMVTAVGEFWQKLWKMELDRSFVCDFEEYQNADPDNCEIHIYIGLK